MPNGVGFTKRCRCAYSQPETAASSADATNTTSLLRGMLTPIASAITRPPFNARIALPSREASRFCTSATTPNTNAQASHANRRPLSTIQPNTSMGGTPLNPVWPPRKFRLPARKNRLNPQAIVASGR